MNQTNNPNDLSRPPNDVCRCLDDSCEFRERCSRWVFRHDVGPMTPTDASMRWKAGCEMYDYG